MILEGTDFETTIPQGKIVINLKHTDAKEMFRLHHILQTFFDQGVFNTRNGKIHLHFNDEGNLKVIDVEASKWRDGKEVTHRVAIYESVLVEIDTSDIMK